MVAYLDLIGSMVIRAGIVLILLRLTVSMQDVLYERTERAVLDKNLTTISQVVSQDINQIGYNVGGSSFVTIDTSHVVFYGDVDYNGTPEQIEYYAVPADMTGNGDSVRYVLHRKSGTWGMDVPMTVQLSRMRFWYYDSLGTETADTARVRSIFVLLQLRSSSFFNGRYPTASWQAQLFPQNL
jgi:hypothetical protein